MAMNQDPSALIKQLKMLPDPALQQFAAANKGDTSMVALAIGESNNRKKLRAAQQAQAAGVKPPPVVDQDIAQIAPPPQQVAQAQLPEEQGIGALPAPNMQRLADGGIAGYGDGGPTEQDPNSVLAYNNEPVMRMAEGGIAHFRKGGMDDDVFNTAFLRTLKYEGGRTNDTGGDTKYGISKKSNPDVDIDKLTVEGARKLYKERYWNAISGDKLAAINPTLAQIAFDTAVNQSPAKAKQFVTESGGDPAKYMQLRGEHYAGLVEKNPNKYGAYAKGWINRLGNLATDLAIPSARAEEAPGQAAQNKPTAFDAASQIPTGGKPGAGPTPALPTPEKGFFGRQADKLGLSEDTQRNISNLNNAFAGALGPAYIPSYLPKTAGLLDLARSGGEKLYGRVFPAAGQLTEAQIKAMQAGKAAEAAKTAQFAQEAQMAGALPGEFRAAEQVAGTANAPSAAMKVQEASMAREAADAQRIQQAARLGQYGSQVAATTGADEQTDKKGIAALTGGKGDANAPDNIDVGGGYNPAIGAGDKATAKAAEGKSPNSRFSDDDLLMLGLGMMANNRPGTGNKLGDLVASAGQAGIGAISAKREREKSEREDLYRQALAREATAKADYYGSLSGGTAATSQAMKAANDMYDNWMNSLDKMGKMELQQHPEIAQQKQQEFLRQAFAAFKMNLPAELAGGAPVAASQSDPLGLFPGRKG